MAGIESVALAPPPAGKSGTFPDRRIFAWGNNLNPVRLSRQLSCISCTVAQAFTIRTRAHRTSPLALYQCLTHVTKGPRICANRSAIRQREAEAAALETVRHQLLHPDDVLPILEGAVRELQRSDAETKRQQIAAEQDRLSIELARLTEAIAVGGGASASWERWNAREAQLETLGEVTALDQLTQVGRLDRIQLERTARECLADGTAVEFRGTGVLDPVLHGIVDGDGLPKASGSRWSHHRSDADFRRIGPSGPSPCCHRSLPFGRRPVKADAVLKPFPGFATPNCKGRKQ